MPFLPRSPPATVTGIDIHVIRLEKTRTGPIAGDLDEVAGPDIGLATVHDDRHEAPRGVVADDEGAARVIDAFDDAAQRARRGAASVVRAIVVIVVTAAVVVSAEVEGQADAEPVVMVVPVRDEERIVRAGDPDVVAAAVPIDPADAATGMISLAAMCVAARG